MRAVWLILGLTFTLFGVAGVALPLVPTTPFLLLAAYAFTRSSPRLHAWLIGHPRFGPLITNWQHHGSIDKQSKIMAVVFMAATLLLSWLLGVKALVLVIQAAVLGCVAIFILSRPSGPRLRKGGGER
ncbi:YbaN family protein [Chelativorans sp. Marseille-P2723]|uniref:YbaN family protein n=1 Tax=Chelativorans sp. Marseille-P2723 TaxID=2709133 RepID=UPI00156DF92D|nr:YbaN family protein [Chelativorans sp. Marseille-P2723]